jgi:hypothetical protein
VLGQQQVLHERHDRRAGRERRVVAQAEQDVGVAAPGRARQPHVLGEQPGAAPARRQLDHAGQAVDRADDLARRRADVGRRLDVIAPAQRAQHVGQEAAAAVGQALGGVEPLDGEAQRSIVGVSRHAAGEAIRRRSGHHRRGLRQLPAAASSARRSSA